MSRCLLCFCLAWGTASAIAQDREPESWNARFQSTYVWQTKPAFNSPYEGPHSLLGTHEKSYSLTATAAFGVRLTRNTELYFDPELALGVPLSNLLGLAGFTNGEMARTSGPNPTIYRARLFVRQVIPLGEAEDVIDSGMNQLGGSYAKQRFVLTAGNLSVLDIFDANLYSHDPRTQFLNWTLMTYGAYDYAADARGYSWGVAGEYIAEGWSLRAGRFIQPKEPNQLALDARIFRHYGDQVELEYRYALSDDRPGAIRVLAFRNRTFMARYDDALASALQTGSVPSLDPVRTADHTKVGIGVNAEQALSKDVGLFARTMWADGQTETYAFTEVDRSLSFGLTTKGTSWGRPDDTLGLAVANNGLSATHRRFLELGGLTFFLGDGRLSYGAERIVEAYYALGAAKGVTVSLDYQRIWNPGYNADRGPASFYGLRGHVEF
jgi:high affinity Mn2+ porin